MYAWENEGYTNKEVSQVSRDILKTGIFLSIDILQEVVTQVENSASDQRASNRDSNSLQCFAAL